MMKEVGVRAADPAGDGFQGDRRWAFGEQQLARRLESGGSAFFGAEAASY
jgi:hypothetical protein